MWLQYIFGLAICYLGFRYLKQITTWTLPSFRQGIVVHKYTESFSGKIPTELMNREIVFKNIIFRFISPNSGLFKAHPPLTLFKNRIRNYFPSLLGEVELSDTGMAQITLRIPLPIILISLAFFTALVISNIEGTFTINSFLLRVLKGGLVMMIFGILFIFGFLIEKEHLHEGFMLLKESAKTGTLV